MNETNLGPSTTGLDPKVAGLLCYLGAFITGIIFLIVEKENRFVKFHALQSIIVFGSLTVVNIVLGLIPILGAIVSFILAPLTFILWIVLMLLALQGKQFKLPFAGDIAEQQMNKF
ncbi:putative membrane protein [Paenibacillus anaericanus]|uniref:DUF4870 domain-containing protein n=1 Tax=Paenibacillus anaericanus TaxID=170367 RepID=UPI0027889961|nr:DUF4870 domain-containing protein [Paenibacillus anaericanus]MDQ0090021.1 putative membrane protein [Paenibacillus anaericanus]